MTHSYGSRGRDLRICLLPPLAAREWGETDVGVSSSDTLTRNKIDGDKFLRALRVQGADVQEKFIATPAKQIAEESYLRSLRALTAAALCIKQNWESDQGSDYLKGIYMKRFNMATASLLALLIGALRMAQRRMRRVVSRVRLWVESQDTLQGAMVSLALPLGAPSSTIGKR